MLAHLLQFSFAPNAVNANYYNYKSILAIGESLFTIFALLALLSDAVSDGATKNS